MVRSNDKRGYFELKDPRPLYDETELAVDIQSPPLIGEVQQLRSRIDDLQRELARLEERLHPILLPEGPEPDSATAEREQMAPLQAECRAAWERVTACTHDLGRIMSRLTV